MELERRSPSEDKLPLHEDIMQLARLGEIEPVKQLFEDGKFDAQYQDREGITPLHWAAINNHYALCKFLIESGADVNVKGGDSVATPAMWAAQKCHYYIVHLLLKNGADPLVTDAQGYNILHLATIDGNVFLLVLLLHQNIPIDGPDYHGHTSLMWAAYKGYSACVDLFLRWGASVSVTDGQGFTALHWALVKGSPICIQKLIEHGSDRFMETNTGRTPALVAEDMGSVRAWHRALTESGFRTDGTIKTFALPYTSFIKSRRFLNRFFFLCPFVVLVLVFSILSKMVIYAAVPLSLFCAYFLQWVAQQVLLWAPSDMRHLHRTSYLAGIFAASLFWIGVRWFMNILPTTYSSNPFLNILFAISYGLCTYFYSISMIEDPGYVPKLGSRAQQKAVVEELLSLWKFDEQNFCVQCLIRMPVRSKHCKRCKRCVAKEDHHCPWIHNCVGANNHRHFFLYIAFLEIGILLFISLVFRHLENLPAPAQTQCNIVSDAICQIVLRDTFTVALGLWAVLQLVWVTMLLIVQLLQIARARTTFESMGGRVHHGWQASEAITSALVAGSTSMRGAQLGLTGMGPDPALPPGPRHTRPRHEGFFLQWIKLLGLDTFVATATGGVRARRRGNPFSRGVVTNCKDFWCDSAPYFGRRENGAAMLGGEVVNYSRMYETPPRMKARRSPQGGESGLYHSIGSEDAV